MKSSRLFQRAQAIERAKGLLIFVTMRGMNRVLFASLGRTARSLLLLLVVLQGAVAAAQSSLNGERRVALVVGNSSYRSSPLKNPQNDAGEVSKALRNLDFEVVERENLGREAFSLAIREFGDRLKGAHVALFYFAGHGLQVKGRNYLVPVDADIAREDEVPYRSLDVNEVLDKMDSARTAINLMPNKLQSVCILRTN